MADERAAPRISAPDWRRRLNRRWRQLAAALGFAIFGAGTLALSLIVAPLLTLTMRPPRRHRAMRALIRRGCTFYRRCLQRLGLIDCRTSGLEHLSRERIIVIANHPTLIDALLLLALIDDAVVIAKSALAASPFVGALLRTAGYVGNDDGPAMLDAAAAALAGGARVLIFPESSRTPPGGAVRLRRGAAQLAVRTGCPIVAVTIRVSSPLLYKGAAWYQMPLDKPRFDVVVWPALDVAPFSRGHRPAALAARELNDRLQTFYETELKGSGAA